MQLRNRDSTLAARSTDQRGLSLVELMVGIAIGLFVVAGAATLTSALLSDNRRLLLETQLQQDLRSSADIIARDLRRAGYWGTAEQGISSPTADAVRNPWATVTRTGEQKVEYYYRRGPGSTTNEYGFLLDTASHTLRTKMDTGGWQDLTDSRTMHVIGLTITEVASPGTLMPCPKLCAGGTDACWPRVVVRSLNVDITARAANDASVVRRLRTNVRLRNDFVQFNNGANPICPA